ncbi:homeobox-domain-containing protein [Neolentinus lepideus HHB14362 ss-1]|uniref:Homeobox-domain-containing protein n=1 Tax=Neolentinus lepideus HHB14362 ss-1 TaxID=1314782 RepID=A0A165TIS2_9AGAM|nr:homeobox-domain-containing protein [Neolentinus lepideus HHB14362 ss-1]
MSDQRDAYFYDSFSRPSRGGTPSVGFSNMGQGGRTNLPPLHTALQTLPPPVPNTYPTYYNQQQQPTQGRNDYNSALYGQGTWPSNTASSQYHQSSSYGVYQDPGRASQPSYSSYPSRSSPAPLPNPTDFPRLPPIIVPPQNSREERWAAPPYNSMSNHHSSHTGGHYQGHPTPHSSSHTATNLRSSTATYPDPYGSHYSTYQPPSYGHAEAPDPRQLPGAVPPVNPSSRMSMAAPRISSGVRGATIRPDMHGYTPYPPQARASVPPPAPNYMAEPDTPITEATIKKKRKRADAAQLKVLNEVYQRTAFPSTEERQELAKKLDMSARSVQIWFQNKRQAMRQSNRQTAAATTTSHHESTTMHPHTPHVPAESPVSPVGGYGSSPTPPIGSSSRAIPAPPYMSRPPEGVSFHSMGRSPQSTPVPRRVHSPDEHGDARKWSRYP